MLATALLLTTGPLLWCVHDHVATLPIGPHMLQPGEYSRTSTPGDRAIDCYMFYFSLHAFVPVRLSVRNKLGKESCPAIRQARCRDCLGRCALYAHAPVSTMHAVLYC